MGSAASATSLGLVGGNNRNHGQMVDDRNLARSRYFCHNCRRSSYSNDTEDIMECSFCGSTFIEHINEEDLVDQMQVGAQNELTSEQSRRIVNATLMLRLIENQIRAELQELQSVSHAEHRLGRGVDVEALAQAQAATAKRLIRCEECTLTRSELDNIWMVRCTLDMACSQPACPICSEEFTVYNDFDGTGQGDPTGGSGTGRSDAADAKAESGEETHAIELRKRDELGLGDSDPIPLPTDQAATIKDLRASASRRVLSLPCRHIYHRGCVLPWLQSKHTCPICRFELNKDVPTLECIERLASTDVQYKILMEEDEAFLKARERVDHEEEEKRKEGTLAAPGKLVDGNTDPDEDEAAVSSFSRLMGRANVRRKEYRRKLREEAKQNGMTGVGVDIDTSSSEDEAEGPPSGRAKGGGEGADAKESSSSGADLGAKSCDSSRGRWEQKRAHHYERLQDLLFTPRTRHEQGELLLNLIERRRAIDEINFNVDSKRFMAERQVGDATPGEGSGAPGGSHADISRSLLDALFQTGGPVGSGFPGLGGDMQADMQAGGTQRLGQLAEEEEEDEGAVPVVDAPFRGSAHNSTRGSPHSSAHASTHNSPQRLEVMSTSTEIRQLLNMVNTSSLMQSHTRGIQIFTEDGQAVTDEFVDDGIDDDGNIVSSRNSPYMPRLNAGDEAEIALTNQLLRTYRPHVLSRNSDSESSNSSVNESLAQFNMQSQLLGNAQAAGGVGTGLGVSPLMTMEQAQVQTRGVGRFVLHHDSDEEDEAYLNRSELIAHPAVAAAVVSGASSGRPRGLDDSELDVETEESIRSDIQRNRYSRTYQQWIRGLPGDNPYAILWQQITGGMEAGAGSEGVGSSVSSSSSSIRGIGRQSTQELRTSRQLPTGAVAGSAGGLSSRLGALAATSGPPTNSSSFTEYVYNNPVNQPGRQPLVSTSNNTSNGNNINAELARHRLGNTSSSCYSASSSQSGTGGSYSGGSISNRVAAAAAREEYENMYNEFSAAAVNAINENSSNSAIANATALLAAGAGRSGHPGSTAAGSATAAAVGSAPRGLISQTVTLNRRGQPINMLGRVATVEPTPTPDMGPRSGAGTGVSQSIHDDVD